MRIILASQSPRRKEILSNIGLNFEVIVSEADENVDSSLTPYEAVEEISRRKAEAVLSSVSASDTVIIGADTAVYINGRILGKPKSKEDAFSILKMLSGKIHKVFTGVTVIKNGIADTFSAVTSVEFYELNDEEIEKYIETGEPMDKAGAYGIQGLGCLFVKGIVGDYYNTVGLPVAETIRHIFN